MCETQSRQASRTPPFEKHKGWGNLSNCTDAVRDPLEWEGGEAPVKLTGELPATAVKEQHSDQVPEFVSVQHYDLSRNEPSH